MRRTCRRPAAPPSAVQTRTPRGDAPMSNTMKFYIDGGWVDPVKPHPFDVINPATEQPVAQISLGSAADVDRAVKAARAAFPSYSHTSREERIDLLKRI